jgi:hypothetical protein
MDPVATAVLSSALMAAVIGAVVGGFFNLVVKHHEYRNSYYGEVIRRRLGACDSVENLINIFSLVAIDQDNTLFHDVLAKNKLQPLLVDIVHPVIRQNLWLSAAVASHLGHLNSILFHMPEEVDDRVKFAKDNYIQINSICQEMRSALASDMIGLYRVKEFLEAKKQRETRLDWPEVAPPYKMGTKDV